MTPMSLYLILAPLRTALFETIVKIASVASAYCGISLLFQDSEQVNFLSLSYAY
jgi:hypothetical protein